MSDQPVPCQLCLSAYDKGARQRVQNIVDALGYVLLMSFLLTLAFFLAENITPDAKVSSAFVTLVILAVWAGIPLRWRQDIYHFSAGGRQHFHAPEHAPKNLGGKWYLENGHQGSPVPVDGKIIRFRINLSSDDLHLILNPDSYTRGIDAAWCSIRTPDVYLTTTCNIGDTDGYGLAIPISRVLTTINETRDTVELLNRYHNHTDYLGSAIGDAIAFAESSKGTQRSKVAADMRGILERALQLFPEDRRTSWISWGRARLAREKSQAPMVAK